MASSLQIRSQDSSIGRRKAFEDAAKMQALVEEDCGKSGKPVPDYHLTELIGKGSFGRVYKASHAKDGKVVAVKIIDVDESDTLNPKLADTYSEFLKEVNALQLLSEGGAENINYVLEALPVGHAMWMVTEYCAGGSVATLMKPTAPGGLQEKWIIPILREVSVAIFWVHRQGIIHRDIKCANVLVTEVGGVQLCDFGVAGMMETKFDKRSTFIGTPHWMAPELFDPNAQYGTEVDIWAFGSMVYEIASGLPPNVGANVGLPQFGGFLREHIPRLEGPQYSNELTDLVAFCLVESPQERPAIEKVQNHPYLRNTSSKYPTSSLAALVRAYKLWEERGGSRKSLFNPLIGAQGPDLASTSMAADEWNFSTTLAFDEQIHDNSDGLTDFDAVRDVYGTQVDFPGNFTEDTARPKTKSRRRPPPQALAAVKAPLEKVFDPNTISNYVENSQAYYGRPPMPPPAASDLPLRDDSLHATLRESLIDLDASLGGSELSKFAEMDTIKAGPGARASMDNGWSFAGASASNDEWSSSAGISNSSNEWSSSAGASNPNNEWSSASASNPNTEWSFASAGPSDPQYSRAPLSDPADSTNGRHGANWQWPNAIPPASANPEISTFSFNDDRLDPASNGRPRLMHHPTEPVGLPSQGYDLQIPRSTNDRLSVSSLIDLDEGLVESGLPTILPELTRPSTANSDVGSITGSDMGGSGANPFELERHASVYAPLPLTNREPSIYVSDDSEFASVLAKNNTDLPNLSTSTLNTVISLSEQTMRRQHNGHTVSDGSQTYVNDNDAEYLGFQRRSQEPQLGPNRPIGMQLPPVAPPSASVMEARATTGDVTNEMRRLIGLLSEHLTMIGNQVGGMEPRRAGTRLSGSRDSEESA